MNTKLTLKLDKDIIDKAKDYAHKHNTSLSQMVEKYFDSLVSKKNSNKKISLLVEELSGVIKPESANNYKNEYSTYLSDKYR